MFELPSLPQELGEIVIQGLRLGRLAYRRLLNLTTVLAFLTLIPTAMELWGKGDDVSFEAPDLDIRQMVTDQFHELVGPYGIALLITGGVAWFPKILVLRRIAFAVRGQKQAPRDELRAALRLWPWALLTAALYTVVVAFGCLLIVPGLILLVSLMFSVYATVLDDAKPMPALSASHDLVWSHWWRSLGLILVVYIPVLMLGTILSSAFGLEVEPGQAVHARDIFEVEVLGMVLMAFLAPFIFCIKYLYYHDLKLRRQVS